ncbi:MAG: CDP-glycerol glycerophosphotransferase family protein [Sphingomicrobium sp.]
MLPPRRHAIVHGWPDDEGNAIETLRALRRRYRGRIYWLVSDANYAGPAFAVAELAADRKIIRVQRDTGRAVALALTAETTFYTHGLFTAVRPPANRLVVNLWHGDGPKFASGTDLIRSTVVVAGTRLWGHQRQQRFSLPESAVAIVGNPRIDQFSVTPASDVLERLGLDPTKRTVLWTPTYRAASGSHGRTWRDADDLTSNPELTQIVAALTRMAATHSMQLVLKPHPLDASSYDGAGVTIITHELLAAVGVTLYQLLGAADAIISDVSSIWSDYLALDRPIGFYAPDLEDLQRRGKLNVDNPEALFPGPRIRTPDDAAQFIEAVAHRADEVRPSRFPGAAQIGVVAGPRVADRLLDWLDRFQQDRGRPMLFDATSR